MPKLGRRARSMVSAIGLSGLAAAPFVLTATSWKRTLAAIVALILATWWLVFWWAAGDLRRRLPEVAFVLGVLGGAVGRGVGYTVAYRLERGPHRRAPDVPRAGSVPYRARVVVLLLARWLPGAHPGTPAPSGGGRRRS